MLDYLYNIRYPRSANADGSTTNTTTNTSNVWAGLSSIVGSIGTTLVGLFGKGDGGTTGGGTDSGLKLPDKDKKSNTGLYVGIGVVAAVAIGVLIWVIKKKK